MSTPALRSTDTISSPCLRRHHAGCTIPARCTCDCHDEADEETPAPVTWADPPATHRSRAIISVEVAATLRANPGRWAKVRHYDTISSATSMAYRVTKAKTGLGTGWEAAGRANPDGGADLYVRWVG